jgi:hypothetical protein
MLYSQLSVDNQIAVASAVCNKLCGESEKAAAHHATRLVMVMRDSDEREREIL